MNRADVKKYFDWLDSQCNKDGKITKEEFKKKHGC